MGRIINKIKERNVDHIFELPFEVAFFGDFLDRHLGTVVVFYHDSTVLQLLPPFLEAV